MPKRPRDTLGSSATSEDILPNAESVIEIAVNSRPQVWWRGALVNVVPDNFLRWHRKGFRLLWRWKSRPLGRPRIPKDLRRLIREMAAENQTWGEERIANELNLKLTIQISPRTVGKYLHRPMRTPDPKQRWLTFVRNHAR